MDTTGNIVNEEIGKEMGACWDKYSEMYSNFLEYSTLQGSTVLYTQTRSKLGMKIVEVGVGSGVATRLFALVYMQPGAVYYCSDISPAMIQLARKTFKSSDLGKLDNISFNILEESDMHSVEEPDKIGHTKRLFATIANNEKMPFPDASFDRYISGLSLMAVDNHMNQIKEAYRILQNGGIVGASVWGRKENSIYFSVLPEALEALCYQICILL